MGLGFAIGELSSEVPSCPLFDMALCFLIGSERNLLEKATREHWEIHDVQRTKMMVPLITREASFGVCQQIGFLVATYLMWILGSMLVLVKQPNQAQLCGFLDTRLMEGLLLLMIILITASLSSKNVQLRHSSLRELCSCVYIIHI